MAMQSEFGTALLTPAARPPEGLHNPFGGEAGKRFDVYRNNVAVSLTQALETGFPTVRKLVGDAFFKAMAGVYLRSHPPSDPRLATYGGTFPGFLNRFDPVTHLHYLPDIARLDLGLRQSYHAADATPLHVAGQSAERVMALVPRLAPATMVYSSRHAIHSIWRFNHDPNAPKPRKGPQDVLITRPVYDPAPHLLPEGGLYMARALLGHRSLGEAMAATLVAHPNADVGGLLSLFLSTGALTLDPPRPA